MDLVRELKNNASKLLLAIMESRTSDSENVAEKIINNLNPKQLIEVACKLYHQDTLEDDNEDDINEVEDTVSPKTVGHNIYILCHQLALYNKDISVLLQPHETMETKTVEALHFYSSHTAQIEVGPGLFKNDRLEELSTCFLLDTVHIKVYNLKHNYSI